MWFHFRSSIESFQAENVSKPGRTAVCYFAQIYFKTKDELATGCAHMNFLDNLWLHRTTCSYTHANNDVSLLFPPVTGSINHV